MSSFRPDVETAPQAFVATPVAAVAAGFLADLSRPGSEAEAGSDEPSPNALEPSPQADEANLWTPERLEALRQEAFDQGAESAREESDRLQRLCRALEDALAPLRASGATMLAANREQLLALASEIARQWVGAELQLDPSRFAAMLDRALAAMEEGEALRLWLHPGDLETLRAAEAPRLARWAEEMKLVVEPDEALTPSGYRLEGLHGQIDGRLDVILDRLRDALGDALEAPPPEAAR